MLILWVLARVFRVSGDLSPELSTENVEKVKKRFDGVVPALFWCAYEGDSPLVATAVSAVIHCRDQHYKVGRQADGRRYWWCDRSRYV